MSCFSLEGMQETGIIKRIEHRFLSDGLDQGNAEHPAVSFQTVLAFFCILVGGAVMAVMLLLAEIIICMKNKKVLKMKNIPRKRQLRLHIIEGNHF